MAGVTDTEWKNFFDAFERFEEAMEAHHERMKRACAGESLVTVEILRETQVLQALHEAWLLSLEPILTNAETIAVRPAATAGCPRPG